MHLMCQGHRTHYNLASSADLFVPPQKVKEKRKGPASRQLSEMLKHASFFTRSGLDILKRQTMKPASALSGINYTAVQPICFSYYMHFSAGIFFFARLMQLRVKLWMHFYHYGKKWVKGRRAYSTHFQSFLVGSRFRAGLGRGCRVSKSKVGQSLWSFQFTPCLRWHWLCRLKFHFGTQITPKG